MPPMDNNLLISLGPAFSANVLWASFAATSSAGIHLVSLDPATGSVLTDLGGEVITTPITTGEGIAAYARISGGVNSTVVARDPDTAAVQWTASVANLPVRSLAIARG